MANNFYTYKGYPLVRCKDTIYYGYMSDFKKVGSGRYCNACK